MSGLVGFLGPAAMRLAAAALLRAGWQRLWPRVKNAVVGLGFAALLRKFWATAVALLAMAAIVCVTAGTALFGHGAEVQAASARVQQARLAEEAVGLDKALATLQVAAQAVRRPKHPKNASRKQAAAQALALKPFGVAADLTQAEVDHQRDLIQKLAAKSGVKVEVPGKPGFRLDPVFLARAQQMEEVPKRDAIPMGLVGLAWLLLTLVRKAAKHLALAAFPAKVLGGATVAIGGLGAGAAFGMQYCGVTFAAAALGLLLLGGTWFGYLAMKGGR